MTSCTSISSEFGNTVSGTVPHIGCHKNHFIANGRQAIHHAAHSTFYAAGRLAATIALVIDKTFSGFGNLAETTNEMAWACRKVYKYTLDLAQTVTSVKLNKMKDTLANYVGFIDVVQLASDVDYFANKKFKNDTFTIVGAHVAAFVADVAGGLLWFEEIALINLSKSANAMSNLRVFSFVPTVINHVPGLRNVGALQLAAQRLGNLHVFSFVTHLNPLTLAIRSVDLMYAFLAIDAAQRLHYAQNKEQTISAGLDLSSYLSELVLSAVVTVAGVTNVVAIGSLGVGCIALGLSAYFYRTSHRDQLNPAADAIDR